MGLAASRFREGENARRSVSRVLSASWMRDGHSSGTPVAGRLARPTRTACRKCAITVPIGSCSRWGLPCRRRRRRRGALLPHPFTLTRQAVRRCRAVCFLWHFPWGRPRRALPGTVSPWSPDFPPPGWFPVPEGGHPTVWRLIYNAFPPDSKPPRGVRGYDSRRKAVARPAMRARVSSSRRPSIRCGR